jgi:L-2,4-diaminobutyrate decarboxylase
MPNPSLSSTLLPVVPLLDEWLARAQQGEGPVLVQRSVDELLRALDFDGLVARGGGDLAALVRTILDNSNRLHHPRYMGHQVAVPLVPAAVANLIDGVLNNGMAVYEMGPAATAIERGVVGWMRARVGGAFATQGDGVLTHGGSLGNLAALLACRERVAPGSWRAGAPQDAVVLVSAAAHYSIARAVAIMGLGAGAVRAVATDEALRMRPDALARALAEARAEGRRVLAVCANAGATPNGAYDPLRPIGELCRSEGLWLHVDGAHGASALLSPRHRGRLDGVELADSLTWDTHKMLGTPTLACALLLRDRDALARTFEQDAPYLLEGDDKPGVDVGHWTLECTKAALGLKLFFNLATLSERGLGEHVARLYDAAASFHDQIARAPGFHTLAPPEANIVCFRYGDDGPTQDHVRARLVADGSFYLTRTTIAGRPWLRLVIMNPLTTAADIEALLARIRELARA